MKKKMLAMMMAVLMAGSLLSFTAAAEAEGMYSIYYDFESAENFPSGLERVIDPTVPEGTTNYVIKTKPISEGRERNGVRIGKEDEAGNLIPIPEGTYRLSIRAFAYSDISPYTAFISGSSYGDNSSVIWQSTALDFNPKRIKANQWTTITYYFHLDEMKLGNCSLNLRNDVGEMNDADVYWDDLKFEKLNSNFLYTNDTAYQRVDIWDNGYNASKNVIYQPMLYGMRTGDDVTALSGNAESIRPVFFGRSEDYGDAVTVIHAVYEVKNDKKALYDVQVSNVTKNVRNILVSDDTVLSIPAKTAEASYEVKSFILDMENGLAPLGNISSLAVAAQ